jgi:PAS domain S-box-containing protein
MRVFSAGAIVVLIVVCLFLASPQPVVTINNKVFDWFEGWAGPGTTSGQVSVVEIDEQSLKQYGRWPWPRDLMGQLARRILDCGASAVVFDIMFPQQNQRVSASKATIPPANGRTTHSDGKTQISMDDKVFVEALTDKPIIVGYTMRFDHDGADSPLCDIRPLPLILTNWSKYGKAEIFHATGVLCSTPQISRAAAGNGFLNAAPDDDGVLRRLPLIIEYGDSHYPSLALAALAVLRNWSTMQLETNAFGESKLHLDHQFIPLEGSCFIRLRFRGPQHSFPHLSGAGILSGRTPTGALKGKIAIVGGSVLGVQNPVATSIDPLFPSVEIQATAIDNLLQGDSFYRPGNAYLLELILALILGIGSAFLLVRVRSLWGTIIILILAICTWAACIFTVTTIGILVSPLPVSAALASSYSVITLINFLHEKKRADQTEKQLDTTEELVREVIEQSESRYQRLVENINDAIIMDDVEGRLVFANRRFREWFGLNEEDVRNVSFEDYIASESKFLVQDLRIRRVRGETVPSNYECTCVRPNGTRIWLEAQVTTVMNGGRIIGTQSALRDITERKQIEAQYLQAQKMESVGRLAGSIAHDFNNLLTVINGYSNLLLNQMKADNPYYSDLEQIQIAGERAAELTQKLLAISRKQLAQPMVLDLNQMVSEAEKIFCRLIGEDIELVIHFSPDAAYVKSDQGQLHQILMNLVVNARDSMPLGGKIIIETKKVDGDEAFVLQHPGLIPGPYVYLGITDTGSGMSDEVQQHIFEPFFTTKEASRGTGLGLATVHGIVRQNGGWIGVTSILNQGTTIHIWLPYIEPDFIAKPCNKEVSESSLRGQETVLVVEDQDSVRRLICAILESYGYQVLQASNGKHALTVARQHSGTIHMLLTDLVLPQMNGRVLAETLMKTKPEIVILYISGYAEDVIGNHGVLDSRILFLPKPFSPEALAVKVRNALANAVSLRSA